MAILNVFAGSGSGIRIPLESPTMLKASPFNGSVQLTWQDPVDKVANPGGEAVATWNYTIVVRKAGSFPQTPGDGVEIVREKTRNQYQTNAYTDSLYIENGITYYYSVFAVSTIGVWSEPATATAKPRNATVTYDKIIDIDFSDYVTTSAFTSNHAIISGEYSFGSGYSTWDITYKAHSIDSSGVKATINDGPGPAAAGGSWKGRAFFGGGRRGSSYNSSDIAAWSDVHVYSPELTVTTRQLNSPRYAGAFAGAGDYMIYAGGFDSNHDPQNDAAAFNDSLTKTVVDELVETFYVGRLGGASVGTSYAVFAGGTSDGSNAFGSTSAKTTAYDASLTRITTVANLNSDSVSMGCATLNGRAVFGGGCGGSTAVVTYDEYLTRQALTSLSEGRGDLEIGTAAVQFDGYVLFLVGNSTTATGNLYDSTFTRTLLSSVTDDSFVPGGLGAPAGDRGFVFNTTVTSTTNIMGKQSHRRSNGPAMSFILA